LRIFPQERLAFPIYYQLIYVADFKSSIEEPRIMAYQSYINGSRWRNNPARLAELEASGFRCRTCHASGADVWLEVHHRTYERLGCELVGDLTALCEDCHWTVSRHPGDGIELVSDDQARRLLELHGGPVEAFFECEEG